MDLRKISGSPPDAFFSNRRAAAVQLPERFIALFQLLAPGSFQYCLLKQRIMGQTGWKKCNAFVGAGILHSKFHIALYFSFSIQFRFSALYSIVWIINTYL
jgi:hypothetical protein